MARSTLFPGPSPPPAVGNKPDQISEEGEACRRWRAEGKGVPLLPSVTVFISHSCQVSGTRGLSQDDFALSVTADNPTGATFPTELPLTFESHRSFRITEHPSAQVTAPTSSRFSILHVSIAVIRLHVPVSRALEVTVGILRREWGRSGQGLQQSFLSLATV